MLTVIKIRQFIKDGTIHFRNKGNKDIECCVLPDTVFDFLDPAENVYELLNKNGQIKLSFKFIKNVKALKKHLPDVYNRITSCLSVKL